LLSPLDLNSGEQAWLNKNRKTLTPRAETPRPDGWGSMSREQKIDWLRKNGNHNDPDDVAELEALGGLYGSDIDWTNPPKGDGFLDPNVWQLHPTQNPSKSDREYVNKGDTTIKIAFHGRDSSKKVLQDDHWHRYNPNPDTSSKNREKTTSYLDRHGRPTAVKGYPAHISVK